MKKRHIFCPVAIVLIATASAEVRLHNLIDDIMVLQQKEPVNIWGWADPGEMVTVTATWPKASMVDTTADRDGKWLVKLPTPEASGPFDLKIKGSKSPEIVVKDVMVGEVWYCAGQSNMVMTLYNTADADEERKHINPNVRFNTSSAGHRGMSATPLDNTVKYNFSNDKTKRAGWVHAQSESVTKFSAVGYYFGNEIQKRLNCTVGLIVSASSGSNAEAWVSEETLINDPHLFESIQEFKDFKGPRSRDDANLWPTSLYNGSIHPGKNYTIKGFIWYQGESNAIKPYNYRYLFPALIKNYRQDRNDDKLPFYFVQIAPLKYRGINDSCVLRESQLMTMQDVPHTGMAVTIDIGNPNDSHPRNKKDVGIRLSKWALAKTYGFNDVVCSGPIYRTARIEGDKIRIFFDYAEGGLVAKGNGIKNQFIIAGADREFVPATAVIEGESILVSSPHVKHPAAVRFGWLDAAEPRLYNNAGLPAPPFRTDDWRTVIGPTPPKKKKQP
jgi:sialate O-acetylesterase